MKALTWHGIEDVRIDTVPDPKIQEPDRRHRPHYVDGHLRLGPPPLQGARNVHRRRGHPRPRADGRRRRGRPRGGEPEARRPRRHPVQHLLRALFHVRPAAVLPVRDDPGPRPGQGRCAVRLHQALRPGPRWPGRVPAGAPRRLRTGQGPRGSARRPVPLPVRHHFPRPGRRSPTPTSPRAAPWRCSGSGRSGSSAPGSPDPSAPSGSSASTSCPSGWRWPPATVWRRSTPAAAAWPTNCASGRAGGAPTPSSTRSAWRPTDHRWRA